METTTLKTENLAALRELRIQEKAIKARIDAISDAATQEAVAILAAEGREKGEFEIPNVGKFQLQRTNVFNFADYNRYHERLHEDLRRTLSRQRAGRDQTHRQGSGGVRERMSE